MISTLAHRTSTALLISLLVWICWILVVPNMAPVVARLVAPVPGRQVIDAEKQALLVELATIANDHGMTASLCGQPDFLGNRLTEARCIDAMRLSEFAGHEISAGKRSHRKGCACAASIDIGGYDTCPHGCVYCYGVQSREKAKDALAGHDATAEILG